MVVPKPPQPTIIIIDINIARLAVGQSEFVAVNVAGFDDTVFSDTLLGLAGAHLRVPSGHETA